MAIKRGAAAIGVLVVVALTAGGAVYASGRSSLCRTAEPSSWKVAARADARYAWNVPAVAAKSGTGARFAAFPDGTVVVNRFASGGGESLITVSSSGVTAPLWTLPAHQSVETLQARGRWVVVTYVDSRTFAQPSIRYTATIAVEVRTGAVTVIAGATASVTGLPVGFDGRARSSFDVDRFGRVWFTSGSALRPTLSDYDLATGRRMKVGLAPAGHSTAPQLAVTVDGVYWNYLDRFGTSVIASVRAASLPVPAAVSAHHRHSTADDLATDGRAYAWTTGRKLSWWQPGMRAPKQVNLADADDHTISVDSVAGPLVSAFSGPEADWRTVLDLRGNAYVINPRFTLGMNTANTSTTPDHVYTVVARSDRSATLYEFSALPQLRC